MTSSGSIAGETGANAGNSLAVAGGTRGVAVRGKFDPCAIISAWKAAYRRANGFEATSSVRYERGWFIFTHVSLGVNRYRRFDVEAMTDRLNNRSLPTPQEAS